MADGGDIVLTAAVVRGIEFARDTAGFRPGRTVIQADAVDHVIAGLQSLPGTRRVFGQSRAMSAITVKSQSRSQASRSKTAISAFSST